MATAKDTRLVARVNDDIHELVLRAAELSGTSITQFLVDAAVDRAREVTEQSTRIRLSLQSAENVLAALDSPSVPKPELMEAAKKYREKGIYDSELSADPQST